MIKWFLLFFSLQIFEANSDLNTIVKHTMNNPVQARYIRFYPVTFFWFPLYEDQSFRAVIEKIYNRAIFLHEPVLVLYNGTVQVLVNALNSQKWPNCGSIEKFSTVSCVVCGPFLEGSTNLTGP